MMQSIIFSWYEQRTYYIDLQGLVELNNSVNNLVNMYLKELSAIEEKL